MTQADEKIALESMKKYARWMCDIAAKVWPYEERATGEFYESLTCSGEKLCMSVSEAQLWTGEDGWNKYKEDNKFCSSCGSPLKITQHERKELISWERGINDLFNAEVTTFAVEHPELSEEKK